MPKRYALFLYLKERDFMALQFRHGNEKDLDKTKLLAGEPAYCVDSHRLYIGDGDGVAHKIYADRSPGLVGTIHMFAGATAPDGTLLCDGSAVSRTTYADLFNVIGTKYGAGDGSTTFNVPDLRGKFPMGANSTYQLSSTGGSATHYHGNGSLCAKIEMTSTELAARIGTENGNFTATIKAALNASSASQVRASAVEVGGQMDNASSLPPYLAVNYVIVY
jgi:microcystin-dependent protein